MVRSNLRASTVLTAAVSTVILSVGVARAASDVWSGAVNGDYSNTGNWVGSTPPGNTSSGATLIDETATFSNNVNTSITIDPGRTVGLIVFDTGAGTYQFGGNTLFMGRPTITMQTPNVIKLNAGVVNSQTFNNDITGSATQRNISFARTTGIANNALFNLNGNLRAGGSGASGGTVSFSTGALAMVRGLITNPTSGTGTTSVSGDFTGNLVWLKNNSNSFTGSSNATRGMWVFDSVSSVNGGASALGNPSTVANGRITLGSTGNTSEQTLYYAGQSAGGHTTNRELSFNNVSWAVLAAAGTGPLTWTGNASPNNTTNSTTLILAGSSTTENVYGGIAASNGAAALSLRKRGGGTWNLTGANTYTGTTEINDGLLRLDFANSGSTDSNIISASSSLILGGATIAIRGAAGETNSQTFNGTTLNEGYGSLELTPGSSGNVNVALGALTRAANSLGIPGHSLNVSLNGGTVATTTNTMTNNVLSSNGVAYVSVDKSDWATISGGNITALGTHQTSTDPNTWGATDNVSLSANPISNVSTQSINTLRLLGSSAVTIGGGETLSIGAGGVLFSGTGNKTISGGTLRGADGTVKDLVLFQHDTANPATISSVIANAAGGATSLTKGGDGVLELAQANTYTGGTTIGGGILKISNATALGGGVSSSVGTLKLAGGILGLASGDLSTDLGNGSVAAGRPRVQWYGSGGFAAYGATRTITLNTDTVFFFDLTSIPSAPGSTTPNHQRNGELLLSAPDSDAKIIVAMPAADNLWLSRNANAPYIGAIRVFNGSAPVDAEISAVMTVSASSIGGFQKMGDGVLQLSGANLYNGPTIIQEGGLVVTGSIGGSMLTEIRSGAWLGGNGTTGAIELRSGGKLAPGLSIGILTTSNTGNGYFLWNGETDSTAQMEFELSTSNNTSDRLNLGTEAFLKGTGTTFTFDFKDGGKDGEIYTLVQFGSTTFTNAAEFSYTNLADGNTGEFILNANSLQFAVTGVPEPTSVALLGLVGAGVLGRRRRVR